MPKYILINCKHIRTGKEEHFSYENFDELKKDVIKLLDSRGWDNKGKVNVGSVRSCLRYLYRGKYKDIKYTYTTSFNKFVEYKCSTGIIT